VVLGNDGLEERDLARDVHIVDVVTHAGVYKAQAVPMFSCTLASAHTGIRTDTLHVRPHRGRDHASIAHDLVHLVLLVAIPSKHGPVLGRGVHLCDLVASLLDLLAVASYIHTDMGQRG